MLARVFSGATVGLESLPIEVEVDMGSSGLPGFVIVGLPDKAIEEAKGNLLSIFHRPIYPKPVLLSTCRLPLVFCSLQDKYRVN